MTSVSQVFSLADRTNVRSRLCYSVAFVCRRL